MNPFLIPWRRDTNEMPPLPSPRTKSIAAFTLTELFLVLACVMIAAGFLLPSLARSRARSSRIGCTNSLKQIGLAFRTWAIDNDGHLPMQVSVTNGGTMELVARGLVFPHFRVMSNELSTPKILVCPNDKDRTYATNFDSDLRDPKLGYFVNVDSVEGSGSSLLCGDRNLTNKAPAGSRFVCVSKSATIGWTRQIHDARGNIGLGDGSVQAFTNVDVRLITLMEKDVTNRLAVP